jgi:ferredoxin
MTNYPSYRLSTPSARDLVSCLHDTFDAVWGPVANDDGTYRLQHLDKDRSVSLGKLCRLPLKKLLLPAHQPVWQSHDDLFSKNHTGEIVVTGLPACELQGAWYLDRVFANEREYQQRRSKIILIGASCEPRESCRCRQDMPFCGDYFIAQERLWLLGEKPQLLPGMEKLVTGNPERHPLPWPTPGKSQIPPPKIEQFLNNQNSNLWQEESSSCLSCGACSAVCPTCYCFDLIDDLTLNGDISRHQVWDNCFFPEHGQVAGGHDFRASRAERLRFRYEHKKLGFGSLRGVDSCTGCGRCDDACPVGISLENVSKALMEKENYAQ